MAPNNKETKRTIDEVTPEDVDSRSTTPKKLKLTRASTAKASKKDVAETAVVDQGSTIVEEMPNTSNGSTTPLANKIQNMAMSEKLTPKNDTGAGLQPSDDDGDSAVSTVAKAAKMRKIVSDSDNESDDSTSNDERPTASDRRTVVPLTDEVTDAWGFSQFTTFKAKKLADVNDRYKLCKAVYDVTKKKEIKPKDQMEAYDIRDIEPGDLVALKLNVKKFTNRAQVQQASFDLKAILLLRKGKAEDSEIIAKATEPEATDNFSGSFYADVSSPIKGKGKARV